MPIRVVQRSSVRLSKQYYRYGQLIASKTTLLLIFSLSFITYFSLPIIQKQLSTPITPHTLLDGQCWQDSPHVQFDNSTSDSNYVVQQIRLSHVDRPVTFDLVQRAHKLYSSITSNEKLLSICHQKDDQCFVQSPPLFRDEQDWQQKSRRSQVLKYELHPFSIYANVSFNQKGDYVKSDAVILSFLLRQQAETASVWDSIVRQAEEEFDKSDIQNEEYWYHTTVNSSSYKIQYKFKLFPYEISPRVQLLILAYIVAFYLISLVSGRSHLVKSGYAFGSAAVFLSIACFTTTWGIIDRLGGTINNISWLLLILVINIACLENIYLLTNAVTSAGCDMIVKEKIGKGLQSVGLPMTTTLIAELIILTVGTAMDIVMIKEFCIFIKVALIVDYILEMTFVIAVLSIDIKRVDLADLDDRQISKRLHNINSRDTKFNKQSPDICPIQDTANESESRSCAEYKDLKTHRVFNALILCFIVLGISLFAKKEKPTTHKRVPAVRVTSNITHMANYPSDVYSLSQQFWSIVNPDKDSVSIQVNPPLLLIYDRNTCVEPYVSAMQAYYDRKSHLVQHQPTVTPSRFRLFVQLVLERMVIFLLGINIPLLIIWICLIAIITWMTPKWRDQWLLPLLVHTFNKSVLAILGFFWSMRDLYKAYIKGIRRRYEYDANGLHQGAITTQALFIKEHHYIKSVRIQTLTHQHVADIQNMDINSKGSLVSCGQDGRLVLWDAVKADWVARLDRLYVQGGSAERGVMSSNVCKTHKKGKRQLQISTEHISKPLCIKVDQGNKWIATSHDDQTIRVWSVNESVLTRTIQTQNEFQSESSPLIRNRFYPSESVSQRCQKSDRILDILFVQAADDMYRSDDRSEGSKVQNSILSVHRSGLVYEWSILTGECIQKIETGHQRSVTCLHVDAHCQASSSCFFTASKDGNIKCWRRHYGKWDLLYTIEQGSPVTSITTVIPIGGIGIVVSGSADGSVRVWDFEKGKHICNLSDGKGEVTKNRDGTIRYFSSLTDPLSEFTSDTESTTSHQSFNIEDKSSHQGAVQKLVATRYCEVDSDFCQCGENKTCSGNGFLVASSGSNQKVHVWRLENKVASGAEGSHILHPRDYHRKQYRRYKPEDTVEPAKRLRSHSVPKKTQAERCLTRNVNDEIPELVDIEHIVEEVQISFSAVFLGKIDQTAGYGLVFCDRVLAGVRRIKTQKIEWEAWFAPLQYCEPATEDSMYIPVETFSLDPSKERAPRQSKSFLNLFRPNKTPSTTAGSVAQSSSSPKYRRGSNSDDDEAIEDEEAGENLPFSTIRHTISLGRHGLACDYGNFVKLVSIDSKPSTTERELAGKVQIIEETNKQPFNSSGFFSDKKKEGGLYTSVNKAGSDTGYNERRLSVKFNECSLKHTCSRVSECGSVPL